MQFFFISFHFFCSLEVVEIQFNFFFFFTCRVSKIWFLLISFWKLCVFTFIFLFFSDLKINHTFALLFCLLLSIFSFFVVQKKHKMHSKTKIKFTSKVKKIRFCNNHFKVQKNVKKKLISIYDAIWNQKFTKKKQNIKLKINK